MFKNRIDAGIQLSEVLKGFQGENLVILAIPRGGLPLGSIVAKALKAPLDVVLTKKIGHPFQKEYAIGAVSLEDIILNDAVTVTRDYIARETQRIRERLRELHDSYHKGRQPQNLKDKTVIILDDGIATGNTLLASVELVKKQQPHKIVVAVPVAPKSAIQKLKNSTNVEEVICLLVPNNFRAVGQFYDEFDKVTDEEAIRYFEESQNFS